MATRKLGRNDPCPCGSGLKFKRCHLGKDDLRVGLELHKNLNTVLACARPVHFKSNYPGHELFGRGSCFIVRSAGAVWLATAAHCLKDKDDFQRLAVSRFIGGGPMGDFFHPIGIAGPLPEDADDTAGFDVAMVRTNQNEHPHALDLERRGFFAPLDSAQPGDLLRVAGFPCSLENSIDGESGAVRVQRANFDGEYVGPTDSKYLHRFTLFDTGKVDDLNGMSGGPVFYVRRDEFYFAGVMVSGSASSRGAHFVDGRWLPLLAERMTEDMTKRVSVRLV